MDDIYKSYPKLHIKTFRHRMPSPEIYTYNPDTHYIALSGGIFGLHNLCVYSRPRFSMWFGRFFEGVFGRKVGWVREEEECKRSFAKEEHNV